MTEPTLFDLDPTTHARATDPATSHDAASRLTSKRTMMRRLLVQYEHARDDQLDGLTTEEATALSGFRAEDGAWKRISDLLAAGWIEDTGRTRPASTGRAQTVRRITDQGRRALHG